MNKAIYLLLLSLLLSHIYCDDDDNSKDYCGEEEDGSVTNEDNCHNRNKQEGIYRCCYVEAEGTFDGKKDEGKFCVPVTQEQYDKIEDFVDAAKKDVEEGDKMDEYSIDCASNYIMISLLSLLLLFL